MEEIQKLPSFAKTASYSIPREYYREGFTAFQKRYVLRRSYLFMAVFALLLVSFLIAGIRDPSNRMAFFLMLMCAAGLFISWYNPRKQRRAVMDAVRELERDQYTAECDGKVLRIRTVQQKENEESIPETRLLLEQVQVQEFSAFYLICDGKRMFYILPKDAVAHPEEASF